MLEPDGDTCAPHNGVADVEMLMSVHAWDTEPTLSVIFGAEDVTKYQFICRAPIKIGNRTFLGDGITEEEHMSTINAIGRGQEIHCSDEVLNEIFSEEKIVVLYRFAFEVEKARNRLDLNVGAGNRLVKPYMYGFPTCGSMMNRIPASAQVGWGGGFVQNSQTQLNRATWRGEETRRRYWDNLMSSRYTLELQRIYGVPGSEYVGYPQTGLNSAAQTLHLDHQFFSTASSGGAVRRGDGDGEQSMYNGKRVDTITGRICVQGESSAMGAKHGNQATATELVSTLNYADGGPSIQVTPTGGNDSTAENVTPVKAEEVPAGTMSPH
ncbi:hypothetical protein Bca4012_026145 [Brassica carinata]